MTLVSHRDKEYTELLGFHLGLNVLVAHLAHLAHLANQGMELLCPSSQIQEIPLVEDLLLGLQVDHFCQGH